MLTSIAVQNYRSLHEFRMPLGRLTVITGANGSGKSNLYRALRLLADCAEGRMIGSLAREGGLQSSVWAGPEKISAAVRRGEHPVQGTASGGPPLSVQFGFAADDFSYLIDLGIPQPGGGPTAFSLDPEIKRELIWHGEAMRPSSLLVKRIRQLVQVRAAGRSGAWQPLTDRLRTFDSVLTELNDPRQAPELIAVRDHVRSWRFYDHFRTDPTAPARQLQVGTRTPVLDHDGHSLAAAVQTIIEIGDGRLARAVGDAFPGSELSVSTETGRFDLQLRGPGLLRALGSAELSDGTLRYLLLVAALLSPRPPQLMVLNEPETSLHPELLAPLARLIADAAQHSQILVVTHAEPLVAALTATGIAESVELVKELGETRIDGHGPFEGPPWTWGTR